jgi:4-diphosphocytidyl-2-C-methyl-D-erythritol kinase
VLVALNELWDAGLGIDELAGIGATIGADVPVFVRGQSAWAEGIGELLTPITTPEHDYVIVDPGVHMATVELFQAPELKRNSPPTTISGYLSGSGIERPTRSNRLRARVTRKLRRRSTGSGNSAGRV